MFCWALTRVLCLFGLVTTSTASPDEAPMGYGGEYGSGMLHTGKCRVTPVEPKLVDPSLCAT